MAETIITNEAPMPLGDRIFDIYINMSFHELHAESFKFYCQKYEDLDSAGKVAWIDNLYHYLNTCFLTENAGDAFSVMDCMRTEKDREVYGENADYIEFLVHWLDYHWGHSSHGMGFEDAAHKLRYLLEFSLKHGMHVMTMMTLNKIGNFFSRFKSKDLAFYFYDLSLRYLLGQRQHFSDIGLMHLIGFPLSNLVGNVEDLELKNRVISVMTTFNAPLDLASKEYLFDLLSSQLSQDKTGYVVGEHEGSQGCFSFAPKCYDYQFRLRYMSTYSPDNNTFDKNTQESQENEQIEAISEGDSSKTSSAIPPIRDFLNRIYSSFCHDGGKGARETYKSLSYDERKANEVYLWWLVGDEAQGEEYDRMEKYVRNCNMITRYSELNQIFGYLNSESKIRTIPNYLDNVLRTVTPMTFSEHGNMMDVLFNNPNLFYDKSALVKLFSSKSGVGVVYDFASIFVEIFRQYTTDESLGAGDLNQLLEECLDLCRIGNRKFSDKNKSLIISAITTRQDPQAVLSQIVDFIISNMESIKGYVSASDRVRINMNQILWASSDKREKCLEEISTLLSDKDTVREFVLSFNSLSLFPTSSLKNLVNFYNKYAGLHLSVPQVLRYNEIPGLRRICESLLKDNKELAGVFRSLGLDDIVEKTSSLTTENVLKSEKKFQDIRDKMLKRGWNVDETHTNANIIRVEIPDSKNPEMTFKLLIYLFERSGKWRANEEDSMWETTGDKVVSPVQTILMHKSEYGLSDLSRSPIVVLMNDVRILNFADALPHWQDVSVVSYSAFCSALKDDELEFFMQDPLSDEVYKQIIREDIELADKSNQEDTSRLILNENVKLKSSSGENAVFILTSREKLMSMTTKAEDISVEFSRIPALNKGEVKKSVGFSPWNFYDILTAYRGGYDFIANSNTETLGMMNLLHMVINDIDRERQNTKGSYLLSMADRLVELAFFIKDYSHKFTLKAKTFKSGANIELSITDFHITRLSENEQYLISGYKKNSEMEGCHIAKGNNVFVGNVNELFFEVVLHLDGVVQQGSASIILNKFRSQLSSFSRIILEGFDDSVRGFQEEKNRELAVSVAKSAIMSRNMSHNLGSHVMAYLKQGLASVQDMVRTKALNDLIPFSPEGLDLSAIYADDLEHLKKTIAECVERKTSQIEMPFLVGLGRFISYLQERQDFIATVATNYIPYFSSVNFKDAIYDELNPDYRYLRHSERRGDRPENILLKYIALSEGLSRASEPSYKLENEIVISFRGFNGLNDYNTRTDRLNGQNPTEYAADLEAMRSFEISLPGGVVGRQAIFSIVENIIRNSAKHGKWRKTKDKNLNIRFDLRSAVEYKDDEPMLAHMADCGYIVKKGENNYDFTRMEDFYIFTVSDNLDISESAFSKLAESLKEEYVDAKADMINAHKGIKEIRISAAWLRGLYDDLEIPAEQPPVVTVRNLYPGLQYVFCISKVKDVLIIGDMSLEDMPLGWSVKTLKDYMTSLDKSYNIIAVQNEDDRRKVEEISPDRVVVCTPTLWNRISCASGSDYKNIQDIKKELYKALYHIDKHSPKLYVVDGKVSKDKVDSGNVILCKSDIEIKSGECSYVYRTHHKDEKEFACFMGGHLGGDVIVEGISGNDSTDRLIRNEILDDFWYYRHLTALRTKVSVFDERLFSRLSGLSDETLMKFARQCRILSDESMELEDKKKLLCEMLGLKRVAKTNFMNLEDIDKVKEYLGMNPDLTIDADRMLYVFKQKNVSVFNVIFDHDTDSFQIFGCNGFRKIESVDGPVYVASVGHVGEICMPDDKSGIKVVRYESEGVLYRAADYFSIHQGLLDKIYTKFGVRGSSRKMCSVTATLYDAVSRKAPLYEKVSPEIFRSGFFIHSGRSKPSETDMPQHQPFIQYASIENAVLDCKYSLVELLKSARYEE